MSQLDGLQVHLLIANIRWNYPLGKVITLPEPVQKAFQRDFAHITLAISPQRPEEANGMRVCVSSFPAERLCRLVLAKVDDDLGESGLNKFLVSAKRLRSLWLMPGTKCNLSASYGRLPPLRELFLKWWWPYNLRPEEHAKVWDFTQLRKLKLEHVKLEPFTQSCPARMFPLLRILSVCQDYDNEEAESACHQLASFIEGLIDLKHIELSINYPKTVIKAIAKHGQTLRLLDMRWQKSNSPLSLPMNSEQFQQIQQACVNLRFLKVDVFLSTSDDSDEVRSPIRFSKFDLKISINYK